MDWIKRNLYFLIGSLVALALMGFAGWYLYSKWQLNNEILGQLDEQYAKLKRLYEQNPHPGSGKTDNIKTAKEQQQELRVYIQKSRQYFQRCPPILVPESSKLTSQEFSSALSRTIDQMQRDATKTSVALPSKDANGQSYSFSFAAQREKVAYAPGSLQPLSVQLGEVNAICAVLFQAKINALDNLRRERVSDDDLKGPQTDYVQEKSVTNELAVLSPYEVSFRCFSPELAAVLAGFASSPYGLLVKTINVEAAPVATEPLVTPLVPAAPAYVPPARVAEAAFMDRYMRGRGTPRPPTYVPPVAPPASTANRGGLPLALDERQLKVTLVLNVVKLIPAK